MQVKLTQDQYYVSETDGNKFGKKDEIVNIDPLFHKLIANVCTPVKIKEERQNEKPLERMNKAELIAKAEELELGLTQEQIDAMSKADIIKVIVDKQQKQQ